MSKKSLHSKVVAVIGIDGSGKSTCFRHLFNNINDKRIAAIGDKVMLKENSKVHASGLLLSRIKVNLGAKVKRLKSRKLYRIFKFLELLLRVKLLYVIDRKNKPDYIITDGSPMINILGWGHYYCPDIYTEALLDEVIDYMTGKKIPERRKAFFKKHSKEVLLTNKLRVKFRLPDIVFFLKVSPDVAMERISKRNEELQPHETVEFLHNLQDSYIKVCSLLQDTIIHYINTDNKSIESVFEEIIIKLKDN